mmetsp:Transcript_55930/g.121048  ORF Transcript_55930/g.121048 Transcript_55930/m.121048 type:complete len:185 (+) Transcript_55930:35-589(+)
MWSLSSAAAVVWLACRGFLPTAAVIQVKAPCSSLAFVDKSSVSNSTAASDRHPAVKLSAEHAWRASSSASVARSSLSRLRAQAARERADHSAAGAAVSDNSLPSVAAQAYAAEANAGASLQQALDWQAKVRELAQGAEQTAYSVARAAAEAEFQKLKTEAKGYYRARLSEMAAANKGQSSLTTQ